MKLRLMLLVFAPFGAGYFLSYVFRNVNAVLSKPLTSELSLTATDLGLLTSVYFLAFALFQLPLGVMLDRYGPRKVQSVLMLSAGLGALVFYFSQSLIGLTIGRALIGLGTSGALMAGFKAIATWFPRDQIPRLNGLMFAVGGLGAITAAGPIEILLQSMIWRDVFWWLAIITAFTSLFVFLLVPKRKDLDQRPSSSLKVQFAVLGEVWRDPVFVRLIPLLVVCSGSSMAILGLWAAPFLRDVAGEAASTTAQILTLMAFAQAFGSAVSGYIVAGARAKGFDLEQVLGLAALMALLVLVVITFGGASDLPWIWPLYGLFATGTQMTYARLAERFGAEKAGRANGVANVVLFGVGSFGIQYLLGVALDFWDQPVSSDAIYSAQAYSFAFGIITILFALAWFWFFIKGGMAFDKVTEA